MNAPSPDGPPAESPLDVERVEWVPASPETVRVLVVGRWRSATPVVAPLLLVADGGPRRCPAEDPGVADGAGRATFTVPLELRPREAVTERDALARDLRAAEQREEAERRVRLEALEERDAAREDAERRVGALRARLRAAELHASELAREMDAVRREGAEAQQA